MLAGKAKLFPKIFLSEIKKMKKSKTEALLASSKTLLLIQ